MKSLTAFYAALFLPLVIMALGIKNFLLTETQFLWALVAYIFLYHPLLSYFRLLESKKIKRSAFWKCLIPFYPWRYFSFLFFNKQ
jgi:hypothetical protein